MSVHLFMILSIVLVVQAHDTMTKNLKVLVSSNDYPDEALKVLQEHFTVLQTKYMAYGEEQKDLVYEDLMRLIPGVSALVWSSNHLITKELLDKAGPQLKIVATASSGYNHCNPKELKARGIKLSNTPNVNSAVAEIVIGLMLGAARRFTEGLDQVRRGEWDIGFNKVLGLEIRDSTVGIIGFGGIGQTVAKRLSGFDVAKILYTGHKEKPEGKALNATFVSQDELLRSSDFVILSMPLNDETYHFINNTTLRKMKDNAVLVNVGRGDLVDQDALYEALKNRRIYAAGLDVVTPEPLPRDHKLLTLPNLLVLPHLGGQTFRAKIETATLAAQNVINGLTEKQLYSPVAL